MLVSFQDIGFSNIYQNKKNKGILVHTPTNNSASRSKSTACSSQLSIHYQDHQDELTQRVHIHIKP